jgi:hypothetical protein
MFRGLVTNLVDDGLSILRYADDTILFMENDLEEARNMKLLLCALEQLSGLKINFHKSELFCYGNARELYSFGRAMDIRKNIDRQSGVYYVHLRTKVG